MQLVFGRIGIWKWTLIPLVMVYLTLVNVTCGAPPNVLIILADDCTHSDLLLYGGKNAKTPNLDRLASEGLTFNRAYLSEAMCQPCRAELYSGQYPMRNGCAWNHSASRPTTRSMPHYLRASGYRVGLAGKVHVKPSSSFPFENVAGCEVNCVRNPTREMDIQHVKEFIARDATKPFCLVVALVEPHVPWVMGDASKYPPEKIELPPNIADTPRTRRDFSNYLAEITYMDGQVGDLLEALDHSGRAKETLVLFSSEQGSQFPGCKWTNWDTGVHTAMIARWPGNVPVGKRTDALIQYADVLPTLMDVAGIDRGTEELDGTSFLSVLRGETHHHRNYAYGMHNNIPEGPSYPIRTVTNGEFRLIRNLSPDEIYIEKHLMGRNGDGELNNPYWATWVRDAWNKPEIYHLVRRYMHRPYEQLYRTSEDPFEFTNLANDPKFAAIKKELSDELDQWMRQQGDPGSPQDTHEAIEAAKQGEHLYFPPDAKNVAILRTFRDEFVKVTPGQGNFPRTFLMGRHGDSVEEQPVHKVTLAHTFSMAKYEVTQDVWQAVMGENPSRWKGDRNSVEMLTLAEANSFCESVTRLLQSMRLIETNEVVRLPSEAEWEYCARAGTNTTYSFGNSVQQLDDHAWHTGNAAGNDPPVGAKKPNPWGLYDMHGYLWEWCADAAHASYEGAPTNGRAWTSEGESSRGILRGGSWKDKPDRLTSAYRRLAPADLSDDAVGLRCVLLQKK